MPEKTYTAAPDLLADLDSASLPGELRTEEMLINMGPQHPSTHGVLRLVLRTDGEMVLEVTPHMGYLHRCAEKVGENVAPFQFIPITDRLDYLAAMNNNQAFSIAVEKLAGLEVPERGRYIRIIMAELNRIASHLVSFGTFGLEMGAFTPLLFGFREREYILDMFEATCGARLTYSYITIGGPNQDLPEGFLEKLAWYLDYLEPKIDEYNNLLTYNHIFVKRTAGVGVISAEDAIAWGLTGPCLRGSGVKWDLRKCEPYDIYDRFDFDIPVGVDGGSNGIPKGVTVGDSWNRYFVRISEIKQSIRILRQCLEQIPGGDFRTKVPRVLKLPPKEVYFEAEGARGQVGFLIVGDGTPIPRRVKIRGPSFCNLSILPHVCRNVLLADIVAIAGSIDVVMGEVDR
ncbi:MAG TPA: NADH-quinone oxidoreductase subunit D [Phycisphaerae bacterium]|jgi:NADH-quinone oxidoreductase subunit D|nr:NADH-quinone oxidoreductase subunit D [Phycisphaerae bacterium]HPC22964.1 NADH-quinone oxidoreductase subunit D [Phycisphaerae bacterium]HRS29607.1 NADH-quinone oxidoreductase subunit D [Phycisphaerae bacterium]HRT42656.1 NADH-quinone oxidoreductase subunit D [Phycisphaerae bacterium]